MYLLWTTKTTQQTDQENRKVDLCLQEFKLESSEDELEVFASSCSDAVVVIRKEEPPTSLSSPLPVRRSPTTPTPQKEADGKFYTISQSVGQSVGWLVGESVVWSVGQSVSQSIINLLISHSTSQTDRQSINQSINQLIINQKII